MKLLFLCMTEFQLLTALNAKYHLFPNDVADIIVGNYHGEEEELAERIRKTNLFRVVCSVNAGVEEKTLHAYLRGISDGDRQVELKEAISNTYKYIKCMLGGKICGSNIYLNTNINDYEKLLWREYDAVFAFGQRPIVKHLVIWMKNINQNCKIVLMDEGVGSYIYDNIGGFSCADECLLYEPKALVFDKPVMKLPKLSRGDANFIEMVNGIFEVKKEQIESYTSDVIFFDQGVESSMPAYLRNASLLKKIIFHNAYKRHKKEDRGYQERRQHIKDVLHLFKGRRIWIKPHPRSSKDVIYSYLEMGENVKMMPQHIPWEVVALNSKTDKTLLVSSTSSAVLLYASAFSDTCNSKSIILYKLFHRKENIALDLYVNKMVELYKNTIVVPKSLNDLKNII